MDRNTASRGSLPLSRQKMFLASLAFGAGIVFAAHSGQYRPPLWFLIAAIGFATGAFFLRSLPRLQAVLVLFAVACLGSLALQLQELSAAPPPTSFDGAELELVAHV